MNPLEQMQADLSARFPDLSVEVDEPELESGSWNMNVSRDGKFLMSVEWRRKGGFGLSTPRPDDLWSGPDEVIASDDQALERIVHLIATGGETVPPLAVRLADGTNWELRV